MEGRTIMEKSKNSSRLSGFHRLTPQERRVRVAQWLGADAVSSDLERVDSGGLDTHGAQLLVEDVIGLHSMPFSVAPNFLINGKDVLMPMVVEEPSVVAAASNAARLAREGGGFFSIAPDPIMICQIQLHVDNADDAKSSILSHLQDLLSMATKVDPVLKKLGGGPVDLEVRILEPDGQDPAMLVVHLLVDVRDAMGANAVNTMGEVIAPELERLTGGRVGLRILSNFAEKRLVKVWCKVPLAALKMNDYSAETVRDGIVAASRFAERDPYRAATHNKGIMNGVDAVLLATGNDWRAVEAGAHAWACRKGKYSPLAIWTVDGDGDLYGRLEMPMAVGVIGGAAQVHPNAALARKMLRASGGAALSQGVGAAGLANNLAALRALATEGIQRGHMRLHRRSRDLAQSVQTSP